MNVSATNTGDIFEQAADWFVRVRAAGASSEVHTAWLAWIEADPSHRAAFIEIQETWDVVGEIKSPPWPNPAELSSSAPARSSINLKRFAKPMAIAASLALAAIAVWLAVDFNSSQRIATRRGELQSAILPDGSRIELGGATGVRLDFTSERRLVEADEGETFYKVEHDPARPFVVKTGPVSITAIGTAFSVRREGGSVSVVVTEGAVDVKRTNSASRAGVRAKAGQRIRYDHGTLSPVPETVNTEVASAAWRRGQLRFEDEPLRVVVASLNRYSPREIVLADPALGELKFTGTVFEDSTGDWLKAAERLFPVEIETTHRRIVIGTRD